jgi:anti-sigma regulatory factor (Ser/Thr protein kinase)
MDLQHGCRAEYGPLELRIQATASSNRFKVYVEDPRPERRTVYEQAVQGTLESAKAYVVLRASEYLNSYRQVARLEVKWRCS